MGLRGLPPTVPIIGEPRPVDVKFSRLVFVVGYLFGRQTDGVRRPRAAAGGSSLAGSSVRPSRRSPPRRNWAY